MIFPLKRFSILTGLQLEFLVTKSVKGSPEESSLYFSNPEGETRFCTSRILTLKKSSYSPKRLRISLATVVVIRYGLLLSVINVFRASTLIESSFIFLFLFLLLLLLRYFYLSNCSLCILWEFSASEETYNRNPHLFVYHHSQTLCEQRLDFDKALLTDPLLNLNEKQFF